MKQQSWGVRPGRSTSFFAPGLSLSDGVCGVTVLEGAEELPRELAFCNPSHEKREDSCYLGPACLDVWEETAENYRIAWEVGVLQERRGFTLKMRFRNDAQQPVRLRAFHLLKTKDHTLRFEGDPFEWRMHSLSYSDRMGTLGELLPSAYETEVRVCSAFGIPYPETPPEDPQQTDGHWRFYTDFVTVYKDSRTGMMIGAVGAPEADVSFSLRVDGGNVLLEVASEESDIVVDPGEERVSQEVVFLFEDYDTSVELVLDWLRETHGSRLQKPPVSGWCSWYTLGQQVRAEDVSRVVEAFAAHRDEIDVDVIQIDDGYQKRPGDWSANEKFPEGLAGLAADIRGIGCMAGIWVAPLAVHCSLTQYDGLLQRDIGGHCVGGCANWGEISNMLDPTHPQAQEMLREIIRSKKRDGFNYFKIDFNHVSGATRFYNTKKTRLQAYRDLYRLYREEIGEEGYLLSCSSFTRGTVGFADASRIAPDSDCVWSADYTCTIRDAIFGVGLNAPANGKFYWNDPDVTYLKSIMGIFDPVDGKIKGDVTKPAITEEEHHVWHSMVGLLGGLTLISDPVYREDYLPLLPLLQVIAPGCPEKAVSLDAATDMWHQRFGFVSRRPYGDSACMLLWNAGDTPREMALGSDLPLEGDAFHLWSFWDRAYLGVFGREETVALMESHEGKTLRLTQPRADRPVLLGTDLHITMGGAEIADITYEASAMRVTFSSHGLDQGSVFFYSETPLTLVGAEGCRAEEPTEAGAHVWEVALHRDRRGVQSLTIAY